MLEVNTGAVYVCEKVFPGFLPFGFCYMRVREMKQQLGTIFNSFSEVSHVPLQTGRKPHLHTSSSSLSISCVLQVEETDYLTFFF